MLIWGNIALIVTAICMTAIPYYSGLIIDSISTGENSKVTDRGI